MALGFVYLITIVLFLLLLLSLGLQPKFMTRISGYLLVAVAAAGVLLYGYGYYSSFGNLPQAVARTLFSVFCMFLGRNEISAISGAGILKTIPMQVLIYLIHLLALYCTASAVVSAMGQRLIRTLHLWFARRGDRILIYGVDENSVSFGEKLQKGFRGVVLFIDSGNSGSFDGKILRMGSLLLTDEDSRKATPAFLKKIGYRGRGRLSLYCLAEDPEANLRYAQNLLGSLEKAGVDADRSSLTILLEENRGAELMAGGHYGYGSVLAFDRPALLARLMTRLAPPWERMEFDEKGRAKTDFEALVVGFGKSGQAALRQLILSAQFEGSRFHAFVAANSCHQQMGSFLLSCPAAEESSAIDYLSIDARSDEMLHLLRGAGRGVGYVVVATGSEADNAEIAGVLRRTLRSLGRDAVLLQVGKQGVIRTDTRNDDSLSSGLYQPEILCGNSLDKMAMLLNHRYQRSRGRGPEEDWRDADYFSRMSCRASADYLDAFLKASGLTPHEVQSGAIGRDPELLENLSRSEHLRWCGFHYAMGYRPMPPEIWEERARAYEKEREDTGSSSIRIGKDTERRLHACLTPWEELDELSRRENAVTGGNVDYKQMDRDNILAIPELMKLRGQ